LCTVEPEALSARFAVGPIDDDGMAACPPKGRLGSDDVPQFHS
jgi:hypothetical protein